MVVASKRKVQFERTTSINDDVDGSLEHSKQKKESSGSSQCCSSAPRAKALSFAAFPWTKNWPKASSLLHCILLRGGKEEAEEGDLDGEARLIAMYHGVVAGRLLQRCSLGPTRLRRRRLRQTCSSKIAQDLSEKSHRAPPPYPTTAYNEDRTTCVVVLLCSVDDLIYLLRFGERPPTKRRKRQQRGLLKKKKK